MAKITLGIGTSHSPMLSTPIDEFEGHASRDAKNPQIPDYAGRTERLREQLADQLTDDVVAAKNDACQAAIAKLGATIRERDIDLLLIVGDDQEEWFDKENIPALGVYWNDQVETRPPDVEHMHPTLRSAYWGYHGDGTNHTVRVHGDLGRHVIAELTKQHFDVYSFRQQPTDKPLGHAWTFVYHRILEHQFDLPVLPVYLNTYYPPNTPAPGRCFELGQGLRRAVESWDEDLNVCVVGSGGLSHFVVDEELDRGLLDAIAQGDREHIEQIDPDRLLSGSSEAKNWITAAGAAEHLDFKVIDYVPYYRSPAGSGVGMGFAVWE
ncbi:extradiol ring-cleavage dioxygenase [Egicoccus halophilus]|uniref:Protocatechuate 4,5-dioxygenase subunit beta n=1 Tax=Egicoccus halophilus TaxID=1670830 RepID=A0A8J3EYB4_9ACTN|nr:extradiol ring-cleavage dioxygenase [Egicoccus halophilus]GGI07544.1 protocatechuate 4,5-dioxygenase subunit beta [Egicoccus halophilus]